MIHVIKNEAVTSQIDVQIGRSGLCRRVNAIHVYREGTAMSRRIVVALLEDNRRTTLSLTVANAAELVAALQAINTTEPSPCFTPAH